MAFLVILRRTLVDLTSLKGNLAILIIGVGISTLLSLAWGLNYGGATSDEMQTVDIVGYFLTISFMWSAGFFLAIVVSVKGAGLIARESSEGTLTLLVSRPINRWQILAGKFVALVLYGVMLDLIILLLSASILSFIKPVTDDTLVVLLSAVLRLLPYILLITILFGSISIFFSTITSRRIAITAILCVIVAVIFYFSPMITMMITYSDVNGADNFAYLNLGGYLGNIYIAVVQSIEGGHIVEVLYRNLQIHTIGIEPSTISLPIIGYSDLAIDSAHYPFDPVLRLSPIISLVIWLSIIVLCLGTAFRTIERKQVI